MLNSNSSAAGRPSDGTLGAVAAGRGAFGLPPAGRLRAVLGALGALILALAVVTIGRAQSGPLEDLSAFPRTGLDILHGKSKKDPRHFNVWIANSPARQEQGLMFVRDLPANQGMLFPLPKPRKMSMWMKNTYVELDIVYIGEKGTIDKIIEHAQPLKLDTLDSDKPVISVLELKGGVASALELKVGDHVNWEQPDGCDCGPTPPPKPDKKDSH